MLNILLSRTDKIGDVILTLPMAGILKRIDPTIKIFFLGTSYTEDIIKYSEHIDVFIDWNKLKAHNNPVDILKNHKIDIVIHVFPNKEFAKLANKAGIPNRIGTNRRWFHLFYCNYLVNLSRKKSFLHEAQLNIVLLSALKKIATVSIKHKLEEFLPSKISDIYKYYGFTKTIALSTTHPVYKFYDPKKINLIIHLKSGGSAHDWHHENFIALASALPKDRFNIFFTGTSAEKEFVHALNVPSTHNVAGLMSLHEFVQFISMCDVLVAASTGPLHIAAALGKNAVGLYPSLHSMHPRRWGALGLKAKNFEMIKTKTKEVLAHILSSVDIADRV